MLIAIAQFTGMQKIKITEILIPPHVSEDYVGRSPFNYLPGIKRLNVFIGPNNTGKSRMMRELFWTNSELLVATNDVILAELFEAGVEASILADRINPASDQISLHRGFLRALAKPLVFQKVRKSFATDETELREFYQLIKPILSKPDYRHAAGLATKIYRKLSRLQSEKAANAKTSQSSEVERSPFFDLNFIYIPTLRGMRLGDPTNVLTHAYFDRTWRDYAKRRTTGTEHFVK